MGEEAHQAVVRRPSPHCAIFSRKLLPKIFGASNLLPDFIHCLTSFPSALVYFGIVSREGVMSLSLSHVVEESRT